VYLEEDNKAAICPATPLELTTVSEIFIGPLHKPVKKFCK